MFQRNPGPVRAGAGAGAFFLIALLVIIGSFSHSQKPGVATLKPKERQSSALTENEAGTRVSFRVPHCTEISSYYVPRSDVLYGYSSSNDLELVAQSTKDLSYASGPPPLAIPTRRLMIHGQSGYGWQWDSGPFTTSDGTFVDPQGRSFVAWDERGTAISLSSQQDLSLDALLSLASNCTVPSS